MICQLMTFSRQKNDCFKMTKLRINSSKNLKLCWNLLRTSRWKPTRLAPKSREMSAIPAGHPANDGQRERTTLSSALKPTTAFVIECQLPPPQWCFMLLCIWKWRRMRGFQNVASVSFVSLHWRRQLVQRDWPHADEEKVRRVQGDGGGIECCGERERSSRRTSKDAKVRLLVSPNAIRMSATVLTAEGYRHLNTAISLLPWRQTQRKELWWAQTEWMMREQAVVFFFIFVIICTNLVIAKTEFKCFWSDKITRLV